MLNRLELWVTLKEEASAHRTMSLDAGPTSPVAMSRVDLSVPVLTLLHGTDRSWRRRSWSTRALPHDVIEQGMRLCTLWAEPVAKLRRAPMILGAKEMFWAHIRGRENCDFVKTCTLGHGHFPYCVLRVGRTPHRYAFMPARIQVVIPKRTAPGLTETMELLGKTLLKVPTGRVQTEVHVNARVPPQSFILHLPA